MICEAATGRIIEVTQASEVVWEFVVPQLQDYRAVMSKDEFEKMERIGFSNQSNAIFRAYKYRPEEVLWVNEESKSMK